MKLLEYGKSWVWCFTQTIYIVYSIAFMDTLIRGEMSFLGLNEYVR